MSPPPRIIVAICTFKRNDLLERLLLALTVCAERLGARARVGVAVVDDTPEGQAEQLVKGFSDRFELGVEYRISGRKNISLARNLVLETALERSDWIVMTDDDCEPPPQWLEALLDVQQETAADAVTGRMVRRVPDGSPRWITEQPFLELGVETPPDRSPMTSAATFNTLISSDWLRTHPGIRFDPHFGVIGGEDMVFFRAAHREGLQVRFAAAAFTFENEPSDRATFAYQLYVYYWHGNSAVLSLIQNGMSRPRAAIHSGASLLRAVVRPVTRLAAGKPPQFRFMLAQVLHAFGKALGTAGLKVDHR